jgi:hypothetical protein
MSETPSIVPGAAAPNYHLVICAFRDGPSFLETGLDSADRETVIRNMMAGEYSDPLRVVMFNPETDHCADVSRAVAEEVLRRLADDDSELPASLQGFVESHTGLHV